MSKAAANQLLDYVRAGGDASEAEIIFALLATGDFVVSAIRRSAHVDAGQLSSR